MLILQSFLFACMMNEAPSLIALLTESCDAPNDSDFNLLAHHRTIMIVSLKNLWLVIHQVCSLNAQSLRSKFDNLVLLLEIYNSLGGCGIAAICFQETWLVLDDLSPSYTRLQLARPCVEPVSAE